MSIENKACKSLLTTSKYLSDNKKQIKLMGKVHCSFESVKILVQFHRRFKWQTLAKCNLVTWSFVFDMVIYGVKLYRLVTTNVKLKTKTIDIVSNRFLIEITLLFNIFILLSRAV